MIFCNVEGVQWLDDVRLVIASDKAKKDQPFRCVDHEQRVSIFALPEDAVGPVPSLSVTNSVSNKKSDNIAQLQLQETFSQVQMQGGEENSSDDTDDGDEAFVAAQEQLTVQPSFFEEDGDEQELVAAA
jgi:hypothetical protein